MSEAPQTRTAAFAAFIRDLLSKGDHEKAFALETELSTHYGTGKPTLAQIAKKYKIDLPEQPK